MVLILSIKGQEDMLIYKRENHGNKLHLGWFINTLEIGARYKWIKDIVEYFGD